MEAVATRTISLLIMDVKNKRLVAEYPKAPHPVAAAASAVAEECGEVTDSAAYCIASCSAVVDSEGSARAAQVR